MNSKFTRLSLFLMAFGSLVSFGVLLAMMFANNPGGNNHAQMWVLGLSLTWNFILTVVVARFLWFQDEFFTLMSNFYPFVQRAMEVEVAKRGR